MNIRNLADRIYNGEEITFYTNEPDIFNDYKMTITKILPGTYDIKTCEIERELMMTFETLIEFIKEFKPNDYLSRKELED